MAWKTKLIMDVTVEAASEQRAQYRWENILEKIKYQSPHITIDIFTEPNWQEVKEETDDDAS